MDKVDRCADLTASALEVDYLNTATPVVVSGLLERWRARSWSAPEVLAARVGEALAPLTRAPRSAAPTGQTPLAVLPALTPVMMPFSECIRRVFDPGEDYYYVREVELLRFAPQLAEDFEFPYPELPGACDPVLCWIGSSGCVSRLHFDLAHNFACLISGRKRFRLYSPTQSHRLYPPAQGKFSPLSTIGEVRLDEYPLFARARGVEVCLTAGELLFLPSFWWHQVITEEPGVMLTWFWNTPAMARDRARLQQADAASTALLERALADTLEFETAHYRDITRAALARASIAAGRERVARQLLARVEERSFAEEMTELLA